MESVLHPDGTRFSLSKLYIQANYSSRKKCVCWLCIGSFSTKAFFSWNEQSVLRDSDQTDRVQCLKENIHGRKKGKEEPTG